MLGYPESYIEKLALTYNAHTYHSILCFTQAKLAVLDGLKEEFLHPKELAYYQNLKHDRRKLSYLLGRFSAKEAIVAFDNTVNRSHLNINFGFFNDPVVVMDGVNRFKVCFSHSHNSCLTLAFDNDQPLGVDIEENHTEKNEVIESQLTSDEIDLCQGFPGTNLYPLIWTAKEALSKVLKVGLTTPFSVLAIKKISNEGTHWRTEFKNFSQYQGISFEVGYFIATIVYPKNGTLKINIKDLQAWANKRR